MGIEPTRDRFKPHTGFEDRASHQTRTTSQATGFSNRQQAALDKARKIERALLSQNSKNLRDLTQFVSNGELTVLADALAVHGKTLTDAGRFYLDHLNTEQENRRSRPVKTLLEEWVEA